MAFIVLDGRHQPLMPRTAKRAWLLLQGLAAAAEADEKCAGRWAS